MPANLTPDYKAAEAAFRKARDPDEQLGHLREMLRTIPKHKGTEHLRADIKTRVKELTERLEGPQRGPARTGPATVIHPEGAAQVALLGPPNSGKSALHARLTGSHAESAPYPFTTQHPLPGMLMVGDAAIQLVDLPAVSPEHPVGWIANALQPADAALLVVDLGHAGCVMETLALVSMLSERRVTLTEAWTGDAGPSDEDPFAICLPTLLVANKADTIPHLAEEAAVFEELAEMSFPVMVVSAETGEGLDQLGPWLFAHLGIVRVYTKVPGKPPDLERPYTVRTGDSVLDVARLVHRDFVDTLKYARLWSRTGIDGQQVSRDHRVADGDVVELHAS